MIQPAKCLAQLGMLDLSDEERRLFLSENAEEGIPPRELAGELSAYRLEALLQPTSEEWDDQEDERIREG